MAKKRVTLETMKQALDWAYERVLDGPAGLKSPAELAENYMRGTGGGGYRGPVDGWPPDRPDDFDSVDWAEVRRRAKDLVAWQCRYCGTAGFVTGLGGFSTAALTVPANMVSVLCVQLRMIAAIAIAGGYDPRDDKVHTICLACLCGKGASDVLKEAGVIIGTKLSNQGIKNLSFEAIKAINRAAGFRLVTKFGTTGAVNLGKIVPVVGGGICAAVDYGTTRAIGEAAIHAFLPASGTAPSEAPGATPPGRAPRQPGFSIYRAGA